VDTPLATVRPQVDWVLKPNDSTVIGVDSPDEMNSSTFPLNEVLTSIIIVGVVGLPIASVLFAYPSSIPPKQDASEQ
jgi:hypothetical protein